MGIPLDIFSLHRFASEGANCEHHLLLKVGRPGFSNADEGEYACAVAAADEKRDALIELFKAEVLAGLCPGRHAVSLAGELQAYPVGDVLFDECGGFYVDLWVAETRFGHPWVVMGTAGDEEEFWREVEQDEDLSSLGPRRPPRKRRAYFLTEKGDASRAGKTHDHLNAADHD